MRGVDLAIYADAIAGEAASLSARAERARSRLRQAAIEKKARGELTRVAVERLEALGLLGAIDEAASRAELRELEAALDALEELQSWVENQLEELSPESTPTSEAMS
jgi:Spy/CpxP family protein refolding chaperone